MIFQQTKQIGIIHRASFVKAAFIASLSVPPFPSLRPTNEGIYQFIFPFRANGMVGRLVLWVRFEPANLTIINY